MIRVQFIGFSDHQFGTLKEAMAYVYSKLEIDHIQWSPKEGAFEIYDDGLNLVCYVWDVE